MPLGTEVGLDIVLDGDPAPLYTERGTSAPTFRPMSVVAMRPPISATADLLLADRVKRSDLSYGLCVYVPRWCIVAKRLKRIGIEWVFGVTLTTEDKYFALNWSPNPRKSRPPPEKSKKKLNLRSEMTTLPVSRRNVDMIKTVVL